MTNLPSEEQCLRAAELLRKKEPDTVIFMGGVPKIPTDCMLAAGASMSRNTRHYPSRGAAKAIWEAMQTASDDERTYRG